jgi:hypothetical protein
MASSGDKSVIFGNMYKAGYYNSVLCKKFYSVDPLTGNVPDINTVFTADASGQNYFKSYSAEYNWGANGVQLYNHNIGGSVVIGSSQLDSSSHALSVSGDIRCTYLSLPGKVNTFTIADLSASVVNVSGDMSCNTITINGTGIFNGMVSDPSDIRIYNKLTVAGNSGSSSAGISFLPKDIDSSGKPWNTIKYFGTSGTTNTNSTELARISCDISGTSLLFQTANKPMYIDASYTKVEGNMTNNYIIGLPSGGSNPSGLLLSTNYVNASKSYNCVHFGTDTIQDANPMTTGHGAILYDNSSNTLNIQSTDVNTPIHITSKGTSIKICPSSSSKSVYINGTNGIVCPTDYVSVTSNVNPTPFSILMNTNQNDVNGQYANFQIIDQDNSGADASNNIVLQYNATTQTASVSTNTSLKLYSEYILSLHTNTMFLQPINGVINCSGNIVSNVMDPSDISDAVTVNYTTLFASKDSVYRTLEVPVVIAYTSVSGQVDISGPCSVYIEYCGGGGGGGGAYNSSGTYNNYGGGGGSGYIESYTSVVSTKSNIHISWSIGSGGLAGDNSSNVPAISPGMSGSTTTVNVGGVSLKGALGGSGGYQGNDASGGNGGNGSFGGNAGTNQSGIYGIGGQGTIANGNGIGVAMFTIGGGGGKGILFGGYGGNGGNCTTDPMSIPATSGAPGYILIVATYINP